MLSGIGFLGNLEIVAVNKVQQLNQISGKKETESHSNAFIFDDIKSIDSGVHGVSDGRSTL